MTYNVSSGTLNSAVPYHHNYTQLCGVRRFCRLLRQLNESSVTVCDAVSDHLFCRPEEDGWLNWPRQLDVAVLFSHIAEFIPSNSNCDWFISVVFMNCCLGFCVVTRL